MSSNEKGAVAAAPEPEDRDGLDESMGIVSRPLSDGNRMMAAALAYAARGIYVFPVYGDANDPRDKSPVGILKQEFARARRSGGRHGS